MHRSTKASTAVIALSWAFLCSQTAHAETSATTADAELIEDVQDSAAQQDGDEVSRGDVIIVTARRRQETAQEVPLAISVIRGDSIESTGNFNVVKLQQLAPTLQVYTSNPRNTSVNIRGLGVPFGLTSDGFEQGVGIYVDDVYNARVAAATFDFLDVEQVEVLRGPQGTLYGKNTTAGAINITTNQPTFDFEGRAEVTVGNLNFRQAKAAISGPLSDTIAARIAVATTSRRGTIYNVTSDRYINEQDNLGLRGTLLFQPNDDLSITLSGDYSKQNPECCGTVFVRVGRTQRALARQYEALAAAQGYSVVSRNPFDRLTDIDASLNAGNKIGGA
ncbi:MAG: TonB-dependent receptor, partial [Sphingorhabdus sp.]